MLAVAIAGESSKTPILMAGGLGPPKLHRKKLSKEVTAVFWREFSPYMVRGGPEKGVMYGEDKMAPLLDAGRRNTLDTLTTLFISKSRTLSKKNLNKRLEQVPEAYRDLRIVNIADLNKKVNILVGMSDPILMGCRVIDMFALINYFLDKHLSHAFFLRDDGVLVGGKPSQDQS